MLVTIIYSNIIYEKQISKHILEENNINSVYL